MARWSSARAWPSRYDSSDARRADRTRTSEWLSVSATGAAVELVLTQGAQAGSSEVWLLADEDGVFVRLDRAAGTIPVQVQGEPEP